MHNIYKYVVVCRVLTGAFLLCYKMLSLRIRHPVHYAQKQKVPLTLSTAENRTDPATLPAVHV